MKSNPQRTQNFWEPIYAPEKDNEFEQFEITEDEIRSGMGRKKKWISVADFERIESWKVKEFTFTEIDFEGNYGGQKLAFDDCVFEMCSFRNTRWENTKFRNCKFKLTTFSLAEFSQCEFRNCTYEKIGISGNETKFSEVFIEPSRFISAAYTNTDPNVLSENGTSPAYQKYRLEGTKAAVARALLNMQPIHRDIEALTSAKRIARMSEGRYRTRSAQIDFSTGSRWRGAIRFASYFSEHLLVSMFGWLSGWGLKAGRLILIGLLMVSLFLGYYQISGFPTSSLIENLIRTMEYWFLFGYTKYDLQELPAHIHAVVFLNGFAGLVWFGTMLPVVLEKMSSGDE